MAHELVFPFDFGSADGHESRSLWDTANANVEGFNEEALKPLTPSWLLTASFDEERADETALQRQVRQLLSELEPKSPAHNSSHAPDGAAGSFWLGCRSQVADQLSKLCSLLKEHGVDAWVCQHASAGGLTCGRRSTGGGGNCPAGPGRPCFFCSRMPYAVAVGAPFTADVATAATTAGAGSADYDLVAGATATATASVGGGHGSRKDGSAGALEVVLVEPSMREIFRAAPSTPEYAAIVSRLPEVWVGSHSGLMELAARMCDAMTINFRIQGLDVPPWRRRAAVMARWPTLPQLLHPLSARQQPCHHPAQGRAQEQQPAPSQEQGRLKPSPALPCRVQQQQQQQQQPAGRSSESMASCAPRQDQAYRERSEQQRQHTWHQKPMNLQLDHPAVICGKDWKGQEKDADRAGLCDRLLLNSSVSAPLALPLCRSRSVAAVGATTEVADPSRPFERPCGSWRGRGTSASAQAQDIVHEPNVAASTAGDTGSGSGSDSGPATATAVASVRPQRAMAALVSANVAAGLCHRARAGEEAEASSFVAWLAARVPESSPAPSLKAMREALPVASPLPLQMPPSGAAGAQDASPAKNAAAAAARAAGGGAGGYDEGGIFSAVAIHAVGTRPGRVDRRSPAVVVYGFALPEIARAS